MPDHGHQIAMAARLRPENAEAVWHVEGNPLDEAGEHLLGRWFRCWLHSAAKIAGFLPTRSSDDGLAGGLSSDLRRLVHFLGLAGFSVHFFPDHSLCDFR